MRFTLRIIILLLIPQFGMSQDMLEGFNMLNNGKWSDAVLFFEGILEEDATNKTALICYARATGLNGNASQAVTLFEDLKKTYPSDFEVALNYAESLLWSKQYKKATAFYLQLLKKDSTSFAANLGAANSYSNSQEYEQAILFINKALRIDSTNTEAKKSRKYIHLGFAHTLMKDEKYERAYDLLNTNLKEVPNDTETQRQIGQLYRLKKNFTLSNATFRKISDSSIVYTELSLNAHLVRKEKRALSFAQQAKTYVNSINDTQNLEVQVRYIQALIWNGKYKKARTEIDLLERFSNSKENVLTLSALLEVYRGDFSKSIGFYHDLLKLNPASFDGNLGIANAYRAHGNLKKAIEYANKTLKEFPNQKDAQKLIETIANELSPVANLTSNITNDNGGNNSWSAGITTTLPLSYRFKTNTIYTYRETQNEQLNNAATTHSLLTNINYRVKNNITATGTIGAVKSTGTNRPYTNLIGGIGIGGIVAPKNFLQLEYVREIEDFNAALIESNIIKNNYRINYHLTTNSPFGFYGAYRITSQSDDNTNSSLFVSGYANICTAPFIKTGVNFQLSEFALQKPTLYFSPSRYQSNEVFASINGNIGLFNYSGLFAIGQQKVEKDPASDIFRIELSSSYQIKNRLVIRAHYKHSNIASATAAGFQFNELGLSLRWQLDRVPLFDLKR